MGLREQWAQDGHGTGGRVRRAWSPPALSETGRPSQAQQPAAATEDAGSGLSVAGGVSEVDVGGYRAEQGVLRGGLRCPQAPRSGVKRGARDASWGTGTDGTKRETSWIPG